MEEINKSALVIIKLIQETHRDKIIWKASNDDKIVLPFDGEVLEKIYKAEYQGRLFRLFRYRYKDFESDLLNFSYGSAIQLEILDKNGKSDWEFPSDNSLNDLYDAVRFKVGKINTLIDTILGLEIVKAEYRTNKKSIDVTKQLADKIIDNELHIKASNDIAGDPDYGTVKNLNVKYYYQGKIYERDVREGQFLHIPEK